MTTGTIEKSGKVQVKAMVDEDVKQRAAELYEGIGMSLSTAISVFLKQSVAEGRMPFTPGYPEAPRVNWDDPGILHARVENGKLIMPSEWRDDDDDTDGEW